MKISNKLLSIVSGIVLSFLAIAVSANQTIDVLFFNDYHGQVLEDTANKIPGMAKFTTAVKEVEAKHPNYILVSAGDNYMGPAISNIYFGAPINVMLRYLNVQASAIGNHEFDWSAARIPNYAAAGHFSFVAANIIERKTQKSPIWAKPYIIIKKAGLNIAFIGLVTQETPRTTKTANVKNYLFTDNVKSIQAWIDYLKAGKDPAGIPNAIIALTHIPSWQEEKNSEITGEEIISLAKNTHGLDAIISAHSHQLVTGDIAGIPVIQAGCNGKALGDFTLLFDDQGKLVKITPELDVFSNKITSLMPNQAMQTQANNYHSKVSYLMDRVIGSANAPLEHNSTINGITPLGNFITQAVLKASCAQIAILNFGGIRQSLGKGPITIGKIYSILPFDNCLVTFKLSGKNLKQVIEHGILNPNIGWSQIAGIKATYDAKKPLGNRIVKLELANGKPILDNRYYSVVTVDFVFEGGDGYNFSQAKNVVRTKQLLRDVTIDAIRKNKIIAPHTVTTLSASTNLLAATN